MGDGIFKDEVSRREAMKTAMKAGAYAAPVILAASVPGAVGATNMISNGTVTPPATGGGGPTITGVNPPSGPTTGGTVVTLTGTNFCPGATVTVNGVAATNVTVVNSTTITFTTPAGTTGAATITVTCPAGTGTGTFTYFPPGTGPTITVVNPPAGPTTGGTVVTLTGTNFCPGAVVTVNGVTATNVTVVNSTTITFTTPAGAQGAATITVTCPAGTATGGFTYRTITVTGEAYTANASVLGVLNVNKVGDVVLPPGGSNNAVAVTLPPTLVLAAGANSAQDISSTTPGSGTAQSRATVAATSVLAGVLTATALSAQTTSTSNGIAASSTPLFSGVVTIGVNTFNLATVGPNFTVPVAIPGVASVTLNRVVTNTVGANSSQTVTALSVALTGLPLLGGATTVDIAVATSGVTST